MHEQKWESFDDTAFDSALKESLPEQPPVDVVHDVTPWRKAMDRVLTGLALNTVTLSFLWLNHLLPLIGLILMLLGFRTLRRENRWFKLCFIVSLIKSLYFFPSLILNATIYRGIVSGLPVHPYLTAASLLLTLLQFVFLRQGFQAVKQKAGLPAETGAATALIVWYLVIAALALSGYSGMVIGLVMLVSYIFIIRALYRLSVELDDAGYVMQAAPVCISDTVLVRTILSMLAIGILSGYLFGGNYRMDWAPLAAEKPPQTGEIAEIKSRLLHLGFPEDVLSDLADEEILDCAGALQVVVGVADRPINRGREIVEREGNTEYHSTVYDIKELRFTDVAVELPGERETWKIIHHFRWLIDPGFRGTESIQLWRTSQHNEGWDGGENVTGRVLYTKDETDYSSPYAVLGSRTFTSNSIFGGSNISTDVFAEFSLPHTGEDRRGYVAYTVHAHYADLQFIVSSWVNYTHQQSLLQYPVKTAAEHRMSGAWNNASPFITVQNALQFYNTDDGIELIHSG